MNSTNNEWLTRKEAAQYARTTEKTLATLAYQGKGPRFSKPTPHKALYRRSDLDAWITGGQQQEQQQGAES